MPNDMPGSARYVRTNLATPTVGAGFAPTWKGQAMLPNTSVPLLPGASFDARGKGVFPLSAPGRFPRGPRISGQRGTLDLWLRTSIDGTARTVAYLTDDPARLSNFIAVKIDTSNRPLVDFQKEITPLSAATGTLTATGAITNTETVVIDGKTYTIESVLTNVDGNVLQGATVGETLDNLVAAINLGVGAGTLYAAATTVHPTVTAARGAGDTMIVTAKALGTGGNSITTTETAVNASWGGATLAGGAGSVATQAAVTPSYTAVKENVLVHVVMKWDTANPVDGTRHVSLTVNDAAIPIADWSTDPTTPWAHFVPMYLVLGGTPLGDAEFNGTVVAAQLSESV